MFEDVMILGNGHSIILGHKPLGIEGQALSDSIFKDAGVSGSLESFGLFGGSINYNTFYPDLKPEDIVPQDNEFIEPVFRMLSECIVSKSAPTDFSKNNVLKNSMPLLIGQTINCDHETDMGNAIGAVKSVFWQESYTDTVDGKKINIPAGINGLFKIDAKSNPRLARGILMDPPSIHSNSVTVRFTWVPSHPNMDINEFMNSMGTYDAKGELICRVVTDIISYMETSLVSAGADPFAKQIRNGKIVLPTSANQNYSFSADSENSNKIPFYYMDYKDLSKMDTIHNTTVFNYDREIQLKNKNNMELEQFLATLFGDGMLTLSEGATQSKESAMALISGMVTEVVHLKADNAQLVTDKETLTTDKEALTTSLSEKETALQEALSNQPDAVVVALGNETLTNTRTTAVENYKKLVGDKTDAGILSLLETSPHASLISLNNGYTQQLEEKFPLKCNGCGSHDVSRASSEKAAEESNSAPDEPASTGNAIEKLRMGKLRSGEQA